ncbi:MAG: tyrosine--tRNA ligase [Clostridiales bacterium]|nr:tyrosine--tRNA ligase [Clostridiales bacterium]
MAHVLDILAERGLLAQITFKEELYKQLEREPTTFYIGFDTTAASLHFGHFIPLLAMMHMQAAGHRPIALVGGGTAMIGDPSGKSDIRKMLAEEDIAAHMVGIRQQLGRFLNFDQGKALMVNNQDWLSELQYIPFIRDIGVHFSVNRMLAAECYKQRLETGLTFLEFNYMLMQAFDFLQLYREHNCKLQMGGDDQWSNMLAGADLIRRKERGEAYACTFNLLLNHEGTKMGKTEKGALWLDSELCSPYEFYQYWRNVADQDTPKCLSMLTFLPMDEVRRLGALIGSGINEAKAVLAYECTKLVHGQEEAQKAQQASAALFAGGSASDDVPTYAWPRAEREADARLTTLLHLCGLCSSRSEARKVVQQGGAVCNEQKITDVDYQVDVSSIGTDGILLRKGKKNYCRVILKD